MAAGGEALMVRVDRRRKKKKNKTENKLRATEVSAGTMTHS